MERNHLETLGRSLLLCALSSDERAFESWKELYQAWEAAGPEDRHELVRNASTVLRVDGQHHPLVWDMFYIVQNRNQQGLSAEVIDELIRRIVHQADGLGLSLIGGAQPAHDLTDKISTNSGAGKMRSKTSDRN